ncbi:MAG: restriction endonuclease subunit S [Saprospiraceae bacterium]|nr:restriction endonuclease subunit S [Saprospiraceae bacterium]
MSKEKKNTMTPRLRFPEFREAGEWEEKTLEEVGEVLMCKRIFSEETNDKEGVPFYKIGTLGGNPDAYISKKLFEEYKSKYKYPRKGEILITCSGTVGKCLTYNGEEAYYQDSNIVWIDNPSLEIKNELLFYMLSNVNWGKLNSTTITRIYGSDLRNLTIVFPKSPIEQQKIAATLSSLDDLIAAQSEKIKALQAHKKGLMQQLFPAEGEMVPRVRFKEFEGAGEWEESNLGENTIKVGSGITPRGGDKTYKKEGRPFVRSQNVGWGYLILENIAFIDETTHSTFSSTEIEPGDILLNITGASIGRCAIADTRIKGGNVNQHVCIIRPKKELSPLFLNQYLLSDNGQKQIDDFQAGGNRQGLNFAQIRSLSIPLPPKLDEQQKIATCLSSLDDLIAAQREKLEALKAHKKGLMQQLFPNPNEA